MLAKLHERARLRSLAELRGISHALFVLSPGTEQDRRGIPGVETLGRTLKRRNMKYDELGTTPITAELGEGTLAAWTLLDSSKSMFDQLTCVRKGLQLLLAEHPQRIAVAIFGNAKQREHAASLAAYATWVNGSALPVRKKKNDKPPLERIDLYGHASAQDFRHERARAEGNLLVRTLTMLPPNELHPSAYRARVRALAKEHGWQHKELDMKKLRAMKAGAFVAVGQGSEPQDAAIVHLKYRPKAAKRKVALVGKGICFDTGGHNLKPAKYMYSMHEDMNGSAVVLGILLAATRLKLPLAIEAWLAIAQNHIGPKAYKQNDVVTALNGTTIEVIHTDAEGRMVLSDTLTLAAREKPDLVIDFATLTGSMHVALGTRYSGIFSNRDEWVEKSLAAGRASGERVAAFPLDADYDPALDSKIADVKQCSDDSYADHILAARFLSKFVEERPWIHMDLSASSSPGGLGGVASEVTGFGVGWGLRILGTLI